jgi:acetoin utilization deacetylase AcuC-like enzyme
LAAFRKKLDPAMETFKPEFVLVSAGFDGHKGDPLGGLTYSADGYAAMARHLVGLARRYASGRIVFMLEGGYQLEKV